MSDSYEDIFFLCFIKAFKSSFNLLVNYMKNTYDIDLENIFSSRNFFR